MLTWEEFELDQHTARNDDLISGWGKTLQTTVIRKSVVAGGTVGGGLLRRGFPTRALTLCSSQWMRTMARMCITFSAFCPFLWFGVKVAHQGMWTASKHVLSRELCGAGPAGLAWGMLSGFSVPGCLFPRTSVWSRCGTYYRGQGGLAHAPEFSSGLTERGKQVL